MLILKISVEKMVKYDLFISYHSNDRNEIRKLYSKFTRNDDLRVWWDEVNYSSLLNNISNGIERSKLFLCCLSKGYSESVKCKLELALAKQLEKTIIIYKMDATELKKLRFESLQYSLNEMYKGNIYKDILKSILKDFRPNNQSNKTINDDDLLKLGKDILNQLESKKLNNDQIRQFGKEFWKSIRFVPYDKDEIEIKEDQIKEIVNKWWKSLDFKKLNTY